MFSRRLNWKFIILLILVFFLVGCSDSNNATENGGIEGYIYRDLNEDNYIDYIVSGERRNDASLVPVFAKIKARDYSYEPTLTYSNQIGYFKISRLKEGDYEVQISIPVEGDYYPDYIETKIHVNKDKITKINYSD
ncbi:hypothetical protein Halha_1484 [Halobacteroides halobius DSM 5150]|uniref:SD-repeat containing protein B domain-containing protein n=1 Tax=Halobacteroides halobius (strain ATCC 35273 / DSM 5150 / MD-1) TaxID=748449 RepID=L0K8T9_HALHC|nr:hypothetical protein [Halobacteroides halobius]AGB41426.1 hypothetical protein Halha_1484 [Halobacteroides halobius DSM 5150]